MASRKFQHVEKMQAIATSLAQAIDAARDIETVYFDRGYNSGGSSPIVDDDIVGLEVTAAHAANFITLAQQLENFLDNIAVARGDYDATLNLLRTDI